ncbi:MAG TPA: pyrroloquinoline quinone biosynthesis peptide chaperone PqqD [Rhodocyclaceae bacterium]|nr:pyrroloquinoline quinone biosynthesis peptide chaperone PqqD [Rhodocyclaceae bacterium]
MESQTLALDAKPRHSPRHMFRWEQSQNAWLLLYPEGVIKLNAVAGEILKRCNGANDVAALLDELVGVFDAPAEAVREGTLSFLTTARDKGWIVV